MQCVCHYLLQYGTDLQTGKTDGNFFVFLLAFACTQLGRKKRRAIDASIRLADPRLQKMNLEYERSSARGNVKGQLIRLCSRNVFSQLVPGGLSAYVLFVVNNYSFDNISTKISFSKGTIQKDRFAMFSVAISVTM